MNKLKGIWDELPKSGKLFVAGVVIILVLSVVGSITGVNTPN